MAKGSNDLLEGKRILIVDDDELFLFSAGYAINRFYPGFEIVTSRNGEDALERISQMNVSAMFMDLDMPLMNGWELLKEIQKKYEHPPFPIVVSSSTEDSQELADLNNNPFVISFVDKPLNEDKLRKINLIL